MIELFFMALGAVLGAPAAYLAGVWVGKLKCDEEVEFAQQRLVFQVQEEGYDRLSRALAARIAAERRYDDRRMSDDDNDSRN